MDRSACGLRWGRAVILLLLSAAAAGAETAPQLPGPRAACPVCGMFVAPHPGWLAQIVLEGGGAVFFDGCRDLFTYLLDPARYGGAPDRGDVAAVYVTAYYDQKPISARDAYYVVGSDVLGPMGAELIPLRSRDEAEEFLADHEGSTVLRFEQVDAEILAGLR